MNTPIAENTCETVHNAVAAKHPHTTTHFLLLATEPHAVQQRRPGFLCNTGCTNTAQPGQQPHRRPASPRQRHHRTEGRPSAEAAEPPRPHRASIPAKRHLPCWLQQMQPQRHLPGANLDPEDHGLPQGLSHGNGGARDFLRPLPPRFYTSQVLHCWPPQRPASADHP
jgi:hypothetical protein